MNTLRRIVWAVAYLAGWAVLMTGVVALVVLLSPLLILVTLASLRNDG